MDVTYPPEPWNLHGSAAATVVLVPVRDLPCAPPPGTRLVTLAGRAVVTVAFFRYVEPSPLQYGEVMATVLVRRGLRPRVFIPQIWVDSEASLHGGRELWAIPKDFATFEGDPDDTMTAHGIASLDVGRGVAVPGALPVGFRIAQQRGARGVISPVRGRLHITLATGRWTFEGPLSWLRGRRSMPSVVARRFALRFGQA